MNILVCISRVPDTATRVKISEDGKTIDKTGVKFVVNPYDEFAIEEALQLKEKNGGEVTAVTVGPEENKDILRTALAMKVDKAVLIKADASADTKDSYYIAKNLAEYAKELSPDLIFLGRQSVDYDSRQMASALAELLDMPNVSVVNKLEVQDGKIIADRDIEGGKETVESPLPSVLSAQKGLNEPRYPKLPDIMKAKSKPIEEKDATSFDAKVSVTDIELPSKERKNVILSDSDEDIEKLVNLLHEDAKVI